MKVPEMKIRMLRNKLGSNDGVTTQMYEQDEVYEVSESLAEVFIRDKDAVEAENEKTSTPETKAPEAKAEAAAPANKAVPAAPENKAK